MAWLRMALMLPQNFLRDRGELAIENLALRQKLTVRRVKKKRPRIRQVDRILWVWPTRLCLHRRWKSRNGRVGRSTDGSHFEERHPVRKRQSNRCPLTDAGHLPTLGDR